MSKQTIHGLRYSFTSFVSLKGLPDLIDSIKPSFGYGGIKYLSVGFSDRGSLFIVLSHQGDRLYGYIVVRDSSIKNLSALYKRLTFPYLWYSFTSLTQLDVFKGFIGDLSFSPHSMVDIINNIDSSYCHSGSLSYVLDRSFIALNK